MNYLSLLGIVVGIGLFIFMAVKRLPMYISAVVAAVVVAMFSMVNPYTALTTWFMSGAAGFFKGYFLLFLASSLYGKLLDVSGCAKRIAVSMGKLTGKSKDSGFWAVMTLFVFYLILSYIGVNGFVVAFAAVCVGRELFVASDVPWRLYPFGSSGMMIGMVLAGSYSTANLVTTQSFGVPTTAAAGFSLVFALLYALAYAVLVKVELRSARKHGEGFLPSGARIAEANVAIDEKQLPCLRNAVLCLLVPIVIIFTLRLPADLSLFLAIVVCVVLNFKHIPKLMDVIIEGVGGGVVPVVGGCAAFGVAAVIQNTGGFSALEGLLKHLPGVLPATILSVGMSISIISGYTFSAQYAAWLLPLGISAETAARLMAMATFASTMPHSPGVVNGVALTRLEYKSAIRSYLKGAMIPGLFALSICVVLVSFGVFT